MFHMALVSATNPYQEESNKKDKEQDFNMCSIWCISFNQDSISYNMEERSEYG